MKILGRIIFFLAIVLLYFVVKEFLELYSLAKDFHPYAGYAIIAFSVAFLFYFAVIPIYRILKIPKYYGPTRDKVEIPYFIEKRLNKFKENPYLIESEFDFEEIKQDKEGYDKVINELKKESEEIRKRYVTQLFYLTTIIHNGFLDALVILSLSINLIKEIFILYNGRVSNRDLLTIGKKIYISMVIGGSEGVEYATEELMSKLASDSLRGVPFLDKILGSVADGFINAVLLTRVALITENYCSMVYVKSDRDLFPSFTFVLEATKHITSDMTNKLVDVLKRLAVDKTVDYAKIAINPAAYVLKEAVGMVSDTAKYVGTVGNDTASYFKENLQKVKNPFDYLSNIIKDLFK